MIVLSAVVIGFVVESLLVRGGIIRYSAPWPTETIAPAWIVALWLAFGATLESTRLLLGSHAIARSTVLGFALGPFAYLAGRTIGCPGARRAPMAVLSCRLHCLGRGAARVADPRALARAIDNGNYWLDR